MASLLTHGTLPPAALGAGQAATVAERADAPSDDPAILPFSPYGYDERQYGSPGFALPVGCLTRPLAGPAPSLTPRATTWTSCAP